MPNCKKVVGSEELSKLNKSVTSSFYWEVKRDSLINAINLYVFSNPIQV